MELWSTIVDDIVRCAPVHRQLLFLVLVTATVWWSIWDYFCICLLPAFSFGNVRLLELLAKVQNRICIPNIRSIFPLSNDIKLHIGSLGSSSDLDLCGHFPKSSNSVFYNLDRTDGFRKVRYLYVYWAMNMETEKRRKKPSDWLGPSHSGRYLYIYRATNGRTTLD